MLAVTRIYNDTVQATSVIYWHFSGVIFAPEKKVTLLSLCSHVCIVRITAVIVGHLHDFVHCLAGVSYLI